MFFFSAAQNLSHFLFYWQLQEWLSVKFNAAAADTMTLMLNWAVEDVTCPTMRQLCDKSRTFTIRVVMTPTHAALRPHGVHTPLRL